ncbi:sugar ABC transporter permease [Streptomyces sp. SID13666]|uniref:carbohydrate ABC transporter permease n=1 Tax=unclassified Streptomyces TaxID=2593676 RepID=UPI0013C1A97A|nr:MULTISPECIES: sugar ABC transporter permease [unclassified Streptomyces]NEA59737.1 sugar ABC transporter permease [Streptomyces sp. SID13666]NEA76715.1 sugar ABC transporter permease [Streptomyces sp. SID13588]
MSTTLAPHPRGETTQRPGGAPSRRRSARLPKALHFLTFGVPGLAVYLVFVLVPIAMAVGTSLTNRNPANPPTKWVGFLNYTRLFSDDDFLKSLQNTLVITVIVTVVANVGGLAIAMLLDRRGKLYNALRAVFFTPVILSSVVVSVIWQTILSDDGLLDSMLRSLGVKHPPGWLSNPDYALYSVAFIITWQMLGFCVVIYLAGLQGVPQELTEAAELDGAGPAARFKNVTWPMLAPALTINTVMLLITGFKAYDQVQVITNGGPGNGTTSTVAFDVVQTTFTGNHIGYGSAMAVVMLAIIAVVSAVTLRVLQRREITL